MPDPEVEGQPAEPGAKPAAEPAPEPEGGQPEPKAKPEAKPEGEPKPEEPAKPSVDELPLDVLLERDDVKRAVQSAADRSYARAEKRFREQAERAVHEHREQAESEERRRLIEEGDFESLGRREADKLTAQERLLESLQQAGGIISQVSTERYSKVLGEETVDAIVSEVESKGGNIVDLNIALAEAERKRAVEKAVGETTASFEAKLTSELEALRAELGVSKRSADTDSRGAEKVSGTPATARPSGEELTYVKASELYGLGEMSYEEFLPFKQQHDKEKRR